MTIFMTFVMLLHFFNYFLQIITVFHTLYLSNYRHKKRFAAIVENKYQLYSIDNVNCIFIGKHIDVKYIFNYQ